MNHEVEREEGELAKLRRLEKAVSIAPRYTIYAPAKFLIDGGYINKPFPFGECWIRAADIDEALKECQ